MTTIEKILEAVGIGETRDWEFKSGKGGLPGSLWETYSAMANAEGGWIVLGVKETPEGARLDGLSSSSLGTLQKNLWDCLGNRQKVSINLLSSTDVDSVTVERSRLLVIRVPRATRTQRPVYLGGNPFGNTYRRRHEGDYRCTDQEVRRMLSDADPTPADQRILSGFTLDEFDPNSLAQYRQRFRVAKGDHPWLTRDDHDLLELLGGWRHDRATGQEGPTLAGLLMFGKDQAIRDPEAAPEYFVDYREELDPATRWTDRLYPDGTWEANLFQFYTRVWPRLAAGLPTPFQLEGGVRRDETPAHEALREAFVNALVHGDYAAPGGLVIIRRPHEIAIENAGLLLVSLEQYHRGGVSECRNKWLQMMMMMIGGGERAGSGADKIRSGWKSQHWRPPMIVTRNEPDRVALSLPMVSLIPEDTMERLRQRFGDAVDALAPTELQALATAEIEGAVSNARLQELTNDHPVDITHTLQRLCERQLLASDNRRRWTTYQLPAVARAPSLFDGGDSSHLAADSSHLAAGSSHLAPDSSRIGSLPAEEEEALAVLAYPVACVGKAPSETVRRVVLDLCKDRYLTAEQLAKLLRRNAAHLRSRYLTPLVADGLLRLRYPEVTNRPDQAYTATQTDDEIALVTGSTPSP